MKRCVGQLTGPRTPGRGNLLLPFANSAGRLPGDTTASDDPRIEHLEGQSNLSTSATYPDVRPVSSASRPPHRRSATRALRRALMNTRGHYRGGSAPTLGHLLAPLGAEASALATALLALPFLSPVSLGPITTPASALIAIIGWQLFRAEGRTRLPERLLRVSVPLSAHRAMTTVLRRVHRWMHRISRPRLPQLVEGRRGRMICATGVMAGALLLAVPIPLLPLTNTFPALGILLFALGWLERDGVLTVLGSAALLLSTAIFAALGTAVAVLGPDVVQGALRTLSPL